MPYANTYFVSWFCLLRNCRCECGLCVWCSVVELFFVRMSLMSQLKVFLTYVVIKSTHDNDNDTLSEGQPTSVSSLALQA